MNRMQKHKEKDMMFQLGWHMITNFLFCLYSKNGEDIWNNTCWKKKLSWENNCTKVNEIKNIKFKIKKIKQMTPKNNRTNHYNVGISHRAYIGLYHCTKLYHKPHTGD